MILIYILIGFIGLILGSFMGVIVSRLDVKEGIWTGRSECPKCFARLKWYDLLPLASFILLKGKCRHCNDKISTFYPIIEITVAVTFLLYVWVAGLEFPKAAYELVVIFILLGLAFFDYLYYILPDKIIAAGFGISFLYTLFLKEGMMLNSFGVGLGLATFFAIIYLVSKGESMGFGDVKLAFLIGFILGYPIAVFSMIAAIWAGAIWGLVLMASGRAKLKSPLPFGTFICGTAIIFIIYHGYIDYFISKI